MVVLWILRICKMFGHPKQDDLLKESQTGNSCSNHSTENPADRSISLAYCMAGRYVQSSVYPLNGEILSIQWMVLCGILFYFQSVL